jgi:hypothetical protein
MTPDEFEAFRFALDMRPSTKECECPIHGGHHLRADRKADGHVVIYCHGAPGDPPSQTELWKALEEQGIWPPSEAPSHTVEELAQQMRDAAETKLEAEYEYRDPETGEVIAIKRRYRHPDGEKSFMWWLPGADKPGLSNLKEKDLPLYNAHGLKDYKDLKYVFLVEGEKAADALVDHEFLALCLPGGAATRDFSALDVLAGKNVVLWPDNDAPGRALMRAVDEYLRGLTKWTGFFQLPYVPDKADAFDYFEAGRTARDLTQDLKRYVLAEPRLTVLDDDCYEVRVPTAGGAIVLRFDDVTTSAAHTTEANIVIRLDIAGATPETFESRLNLWSSSAKDGLRRQLEEYYGVREKGFWLRVIHRACSMVLDTIRNTSGTVPLDLDSAPEAVEYVVHNLVTADPAPTLIFGKGGGFKSYLCLALGLCVAKGLPFVDFATQQRNVLYINLEPRGRKGIRRRIRRLLQGMGEDWADLHEHFHLWHRPGEVLAHQVSTLRRVIRERDVGLVIIDSAAAAIGGNLNAPDVTSQFFNAVSRLKTPTIIISHLRKDEDPRYAFGSVYFHNLAAACWGLQSEIDDDRHGGLVVFNNEKPSESAPLPPFGICIRFEDPNGPVRLGYSAEVPTNLKRGTVREQILNALADSDGLTAAELSAQLGIDIQQVRNKLNLYSRLFYTDGKRNQSFIWKVRHGAPGDPSAEGPEGDSPQTPNY